MQQTISEPIVVSGLASIVRENWAWAAPLIYVYATTIGTVASWTRFNQFGINILDFAELNDFMLAAFRDPLVLLTAFSVSVTFYLYVRLFEWLNRIMDPIRKRQRRINTRFLSYLVGAFLFPFIGKAGVKRKFLSAYRKKLRRSRKMAALLNRLVWPALRILGILVIVLGPFVVISQNSSAFPSMHSVDVHLRSYPTGQNETNYADLLYIGATERFVFLYRDTPESTITIPIANIGSISRRFDGDDVQN